MSKVKNMGETDIYCLYLYLVQIISSFALLTSRTGPLNLASCSPTLRLISFLTALSTSPDMLAGILGTAKGTRESNVASST